MLRPYNVDIPRTEQTLSKRRRHWTERPIVLATLATMAILSNLTFLQRRFLTDETKVPMMYTFYSKITDVPMPAGMAHADHSRLLNFWVRAWEQAGWQPVVLNETHATQHPDYERLKPLVEATGAGTYNVSAIPRHLHLCCSQIKKAQI